MAVAAGRHHFTRPFLVGPDPLLVCFRDDLVRCLRLDPGAFCLRDAFRLFVCLSCDRLDALQHFLLALSKDDRVCHRRLEFPPDLRILSEVPVCDLTEW